MANTKSRVREIELPEFPEFDAELMEHDYSGIGTKVALQFFESFPKVVQPPHRPERMSPKIERFVLD